MTTYEIYAKNRYNGNMAFFKIVKTTNGKFDLYDSDTVVDRPINYMPATKKALLEAIKTQYIIIDSARIA